MNKITDHSLFEQIKNLIEQTKQNVAITINSSLTMMYWHIGKLINDEILQNKRAKIWLQDNSRDSVTRIILEPYFSPFTASR